MTEEQNKLAEREIERAKLHGPDTRTIDALQSTLERAEAAERDFIQVHKNCIEAREALLRAEREPATEAVLEALKAARSWLESDEGEGRTFAEMIEIEDRSLASSGKHAWNRDFISMVRKVEAALKGKGASQGD